jgi:hypothetical protein
VNDKQSPSTKVRPQARARPFRPSVRGRTSRRDVGAVTVVRLEHYSYSRGNGMDEDDALDFIVDTRGDAKLTRDDRAQLATQEEERLTALLFGHGSSAQAGIVDDEDGDAADLMTLINEGPSKRPRANAPLWNDADDEPVALVNVPGGRKLRRKQGEEEVAGEDYESRLREQYEAVLPTPDWAKASISTRSSSD